jgi:hypothetical protein
MSLSFLRVIVIASAVVVIGSVQRTRAADPAPASQPARKPPIDFRKLKEFMPAELNGIKRTKNEGEKIALGDFVLTQAQAEYSKTEPAENDPTIEVQIMDYAGATDMGAAVTAWTQMQVDRESDSGYERTTKIKDQPAFETYQNEGKNGEIQLWIGGRFYLDVKTTNLSGAEVKKLAESLPIEKLVAAAQS